jgi:hypothetical protein
MSEQLLVAMLAKTRGMLSTAKQPLADFHLVSGGSAWCDHLAVTLYLETILHQPFGSLTLHLPCAFDVKQRCFQQSHPCGAVLNQLHEEFRLKTGRDALHELAAAIHLGAKVKMYNDFGSRNAGIAEEVDQLFAFSWSDSGHPEKGGTLDTWNKFSGMRLHIPIRSLVVTPETAVSAKAAVEEKSKL